MTEIIHKYDVVTIVKKSRIKPYGDLKVAVKGNDYLVVSTYTNNFGTTKLFLVDEEGCDFIVTENAVSKKFNLDNIQRMSANPIKSAFSLNNVKTKEEKEREIWSNARKLWMDKTYVPVYLTHFYAYSGYPMIMSKDSSSALVADIRKINNNFWLSKEYVHVEDIKSFFTSSLTPKSSEHNNPSGAVSIRIPLWLAKKNSIFK